MGIVRDNPILWREGMPRILRSGGPARRGIVWGLAVAASAALGAAPAAWLYARQADLNPVLALALALAWVWAGTTVLIAPFLAARTITAERAQGTWDHLILTRLRPAEIVCGKTFAALLPFWIVGALLLPAVLLPVVFHLAADWGPEGLLAGLSIGGAYLTATLGGVVVASVGIFCSLVCPNVIWSAIFTYGLVFLSSSATCIPLLGVLFFPLNIALFVSLDNSRRG